MLLQNGKKCHLFEYLHVDLPGLEVSKVFDILDSFRIHQKRKLEGLNLIALEKIKKNPSELE